LFELGNDDRPHRALLGFHSFALMLLTATMQAPHGRLPNNQKFSGTKRVFRSIGAKLSAVIPGRREAASPESITTAWGYGFRARALRRAPE
jgi:hypothetical protein